MKYKALINDKDITSYVTSFTWSGSNDTAARKVDFSVLFNTSKKDSSFKNQPIKLGDTLVIKYILSDDPLNTKEVTLFKGKVWTANRSTNDYTKSFTAYDGLILLAKSKINKKFKNTTVLDDIKQVANEWGFGVLLDKGVTLNAKGDFIADGMTCTEIFKKALDIQSQKDKKSYAVMGIDENNNIIIGDNATQEVTAVTLTDTTNILSSSYGESLESLISLVYIANNEGNTNDSNCIKDDSLITKYGKITEIYKPDKKVDTKTAATALMHGIDTEASIEAIGNIFCISGKSVAIQEENLKGKFFIKSDSHTFQNGIHKMNLSLDFTKVLK